MQKYNKKMRKFNADYKFTIIGECRKVISHPFLRFLTLYFHHATPHKHIKKPSRILWRATLLFSNLCYSLRAKFSVRTASVLSSALVRFRMKEMTSVASS